MAIKLTEEQQRKLFQHIREKWSETRACPMCREHKWTVDGAVYRLAALSTDPSSAHSVVQPLATVRCTNCSFLVLIHLTQAGIATPEELSLAMPQAPAAPHRIESEPIVISANSDIDENDETH